MQNVSITFISLSLLLLEKGSMKFEFRSGGFAPKFEYNASLSILSPNEEVSIICNTVGPGIRDVKCKIDDKKFSRVTNWNEYKFRDTHDVNKLKINNQIIEFPNINHQEKPLIYFWKKNHWSDVTDTFFDFN